MKDTTIAVGLAKNVFEIAILREAGKVQCSIATRLSWAQQCEREGWRHRESRQGSGARFSTP